MSSLPEVVVKVQGALLHLVPAQNPINFLPFVLDPIWLHFRWRAAVLLLSSHSCPQPLCTLVVITGWKVMDFFSELSSFAVYSLLQGEALFCIFYIVNVTDCWTGVNQSVRADRTKFLWFQTVLLLFRDASCRYYGYLNWGNKANLGCKEARGQNCNAQAD